MMGDDGRALIVYQILNENPLPNWTALDGGSAPENVAHIVRDMKPDLLLIFDAADMELAPGKIRIIEKESIAEMFFMSTHNMPLNYLIEQLEQDIKQNCFCRASTRSGFLWFSNDRKRKRVCAIYV